MRPFVCFLVMNARTPPSGFVVLVNYFFSLFFFLSVPGLSQFGFRAERLSRHLGNERRFTLARSTLVCLRAEGWSWCDLSQVGARFDTPSVWSLNADS